MIEATRAETLTSRQRPQGARDMTGVANPERSAQTGDAFDTKFTGGGIAVPVDHRPIDTSAAG